MSIFSAKIGISNIHALEYVYVDALVDTGATYSMFPADFLRDIDITPIRETDVELADGTQKSVPLGAAYLTLLDRAAPCIVIFGESDSSLIGATTLENLGLGVDPVNQSLMPVVLKARPL